MESWNEKLNGLIAMAIANSESEGINFDMLVRAAIHGESEQHRNALLAKEVRREIGAKLRKWALAFEDPLIPDLLDGFIQKEGEYVHASQLSTKEWDIRIMKLDQTIRTLVARRTAMQEARDQAQEGEAT